MNLYYKGDFGLGLKLNVTFSFHTSLKLPIKIGNLRDVYIIRIKLHISANSAPSRIPSAVKEHSTEAHHTVDWDNVKILDREDRESPPPQVKEAIQIRKQSPALNQDQGLEIPSIYNVIIRSKVIKGQ